MFGLEYDETFDAPLLMQRLVSQSLFVFFVFFQTLMEKNFISSTCPETLQLRMVEYLQVHVVRSCSNDLCSPPSRLVCSPLQIKEYECGNANWISDSTGTFRYEMWLYNLSRRNSVVIQ